MTIPGNGEARHVGARRTSRAGAVLAGAVLGLALAATRAAYRPPLGDGLDGAYYFQIARQVAQGAGVSTSYSVFHHGLTRLPQASMSYPLVPWLIGQLGRVVPLESAAVWLPGAAYVASGLTCFGFLTWTLRRSAPRSGWIERLIFALLLSLWFGWIPVYVWTSARPYTETLAALLVLLSLWAFGWCSTARLASAPWRAAAFVALGLLSGACYLARFQLLAVGVSLLIARALARDRRALRDAACIALGFGVCFGGQVLRLYSLPNPEPNALLDFAAYRQLPQLPRFVYDLQFDSRWDWLLDKLEGVRVSLDPNSDESYVATQGYLVWLVPLGMVAIALRQAWRVREQGLAALRFRGLRRPRHAALLASALVGVLAMAPIHAVHSLHWRTWSFAWRHGLPFVFLILPGAVWWWSRAGVVPRLLVSAALALSLLMVGQKTFELVHAPVHTRMLQGYRDVAMYLDGVGPTHGTLGIEHQALAVYSAAPLYWLACWSPPELAQTLVRELPIERIVLRPGELRCPSLSLIRDRLSPERAFDEHYPMTLYRIARLELTPLRE